MLRTMRCEKFNSKDIIVKAAQSRLPISARSNKVMRRLQVAHSEAVPCMLDRKVEARRVHACTDIHLRGWHQGADIKPVE